MSKKKITKVEDDFNDAIELSVPDDAIVEEKIVSNPVMDFTREDPTPSGSIKKAFNPQNTQNALRDDSDEGGVYAGSSVDGMSDGGGVYVGEIVEQSDDSYELSGFDVLIEGEEAFSVIARYNSIDEAKVSVNGDKFVFARDGKLVLAKIIGGAPTISGSETEISSYVNGAWS